MSLRILRSAVKAFAKAEDAANAACEAAWGNLGTKEAAIAALRTAKHLSIKRLRAKRKVASRNGLRTVAKAIHAILSRPAFM